MFSHRLGVAGYVRVSSLCACLAVVPSPAALAQGVSAPPADNAAPTVNLSGIGDGELAAAIERAARGARRRLERDDCRQVLDDFRDRNGRSLREVASLLVDSPAALLTRAIFRDGRDAATCRTAAVAFTGAGSRVVFFCGNRFSRIGRAQAELIVIHEMLHTLGLGELPPTPGEIDRAVARRCGR